MKRISIIALLTMTVFILLGASQIGARQTDKGQPDKAQPDKAQEGKAQADKPQADKTQASAEQAFDTKPAASNYPIAQLRRDFKNSFPIPTGEKLEYEIKLSRFPIYASVGVVTLENLGEIGPRRKTAEQTGIDKAEPLIKGLNVDYALAPGEPILHLSATAVSKGMFLAIAGVDARYRFETLVDLRDFSARVSFKETKEGKKHLAQSALFDTSEQQVKYLTTDLNKPQAAPRVKPLSRQEGMLSLLSAIYFVRLQKLKEGQMLSFPVSTDEANFQFDVLVVKRESLKTDCGKIKTVRLEPKLFGPGKVISRQGEMTLWVSDDSKHTPLRLVAKTNSYTVTAKLLNFKNKCNIIEQEDEKTQKAN